MLKGALQAHVIWALGMSVVGVAAGILEGDAARPTASWTIPLLLPVLALGFTITFPINAVSYLLLRRSAQVPLAQAAITVLTGIVWFALGALLTGGSGLVSGTSIWLGIGGLAFGFGVIAWLRRSPDVARFAAKRS